MQLTGLRITFINSDIVSGVNPSIWVMFLIFAFWGVKRKIIFCREECVMLASCIAYMGICGIVGTSSNSMNLIRVFLSLSVLSLLLKSDYELKKIILNVVVAYYFSECFLAIIERIFQTNFISVSLDPLFLDNSVSSIRAGFRSASLHSHPLQGALMVSVVMAFIYITDYKPLIKMGMLFVGLLALLSFNTRSSIAYWVVMISIYIIYLIIIKKTKGRYKCLGILAMAVAFAAGLYLIRQGWAGRLVELSLFDKHSAQIRVDVLSVLNDFSVQYFLWGVPADVGTMIFKRNGVFIMENYWISFVMNWGVPYLVWLVICSYKILRKYIQNYSRLGRYFPMITFLLISSTNNSMVTGVPALLLLLLGYYGFDYFNRKEADCV